MGKLSLFFLLGLLVFSCDEHNIVEHTLTLSADVSDTVESFSIITEEYVYTDFEKNKNISVEYLQITGLADVKIQEKINAILYEIVENNNIDSKSDDLDYSDSVLTYYAVIDANVLSVQYAMYYEHMRAAHPSTEFDAVTIDLQTGERLKLSDILILNDDFPKILNDETITETRMERGNSIHYTNEGHRYFYEALYEDFYKELYGGIVSGYSEESSFYLTDNSLGFVFNAPSPANNYFTFEITYDDVADFLNPNFKSLLN